MNKYNKYLKSEQWLIIRKEIIFQRGEMCELCKSKSELQVHHLTYKNVFNEKAKDLQVLCSDCHEKEHDNKKKQKKRSRKKTRYDKNKR